jgi:Brp/Blh family beta-carotene 15,15'-monooxygenase
VTKVLQTVVKTPTWLTIGLGVGLLIWQYWQITIPYNTQLILFAILILLTGIPHGALDHLIQKTTDNQLNRKYDFIKFLVKYLLLMAIYALAWFWFAGFSLLFFLIISAWHFGETDIENAPKDAPIWSFTRLVYGLYILAFILLTHADEASPVIEQMIGSQNKSLLFWNFIHQNVKQILYLSGLLLSTVIIVAQSRHFIEFDKARLFRLFLVLFISIWLPLLPAFALYFGGWHSLCAFDNIHNYLRKDYPNLSFKQVYLKALPLTAIALVFLGSFFWYQHHFMQQYNPFAILFIFISLITLPHLTIAHQMNSSIK